MSIGLALIMITVNGAFAERLDEIQAEVGTTITLRPGGSFGGGFLVRPGAGGQPPDGQGSGAGDESSTEQATLTDEQLSALSSIDQGGCSDLDGRRESAGKYADLAVDLEAGELT